MKEYSVLPLIAVTAIFNFYSDTVHHFCQSIKLNHEQTIKNYKGHAKNISALNLQKFKDIPASKKKLVVLIKEKECISNKGRHSYPGDPL